MAPEIGKKYGPYEIQGRLGGGGMGHVYLAWDARLHREVAIKLLHNEYAMPGMRERFLREARAASALNHPNICTIFDIGEQDGEPYLVMELLQGETLKDRIQHKPIQAEELICTAREIAEALGAAHAKGVIHRDIKPANIFLVSKPNGGSQSKVLDFGLAKIEGGVLGARASRSLDITTPGATVGTLAYMSPEQARGEVLDSRSDLFSLGVVLYEMATRHVPFKGATSALIFVQLLNHPPEPVRNWNEAIPRELEKIILKLMAKERTARFQTAHELDEALARLGEKGGGWLRKAVATTPSVRAPDPVPRDKHAPLRRSSQPQVDTPREGSMASIAEATPRPPDQAQLLRPVARLPRGDTTTRLNEEGGSALPSSSPAGTKSLALTAIQLDSSPVMEAPAKLASGPQPPAQDVRPERASGEFLATLPQHLHESEAAPSVPKRGRLGIAALALILLVAAALLLLHRGRFHPTLLTDEDAVVLTEIDNRTGDRALDNIVPEALQLELSQSHRLLLRSRSAYRAARHFMSPESQLPASPISSHNAAERIGAKAYLSGYIAGPASHYLLHVDLLKVATNDVMTSAEEPFQTVQDLPNAIDRVAQTLRSNVGEDRDSIAGSSNPLVREATSNMNALRDLSEGEEASANGKIVDALRSYQHAVALDPKFAQAYLRLSRLYEQQRAESAAAEAAKLAVATSETGSERTRLLAQYEYEMNATGDYAHAAFIIKQVISHNPHDSESMADLARTLRLEGRLTESLQMAQQAYAEDPFNAKAYLQAENALLGLDRYDAAAQLEVQIERLGLGQLGGALVPGYLEGRQDLVEPAAHLLSTQGVGVPSDWDYGLYLDNVGQLGTGAEVWRERAASLKQIHGLESAASFLLSQGALDRAMLGDCGAGLAMAQESDTHVVGVTAIFNAGMAYALCGNLPRAQQAIDQLQSSYPQSFAVRGFYVADLKAAIALRASDPAAALDALKQARQFDLISLTPYLRGRAHVAMRQVQIGIVDFQTVLSHHGVSFIVGSVAYPAAEIGVARAFADTGDLNNSAGAYHRFLEIWKTADPKQPLITEARLHTR